MSCRSNESINYGLIITQCATPLIISWRIASLCDSYYSFVNLTT